jgi:Protein of unknown function (DUF2877)
VTVNQCIPLVTATRCGNRAFASGEGIPLHKSRRAVNLQFGRKVVTVQTGTGVLSPSSIIIDLPGLPDVEEAHFEGDVMYTDAFEVKIGSFEDLHFRKSSRFDTLNAARSLRPWIHPYDHSITKAMLIHLYDLDVSSRGLEKDILERQERALRESGSIPELVQHLMGIGYGLTPSGDDFILGILAVLSLQGTDLSDLSPIIYDYENPFSRTILEDACEGCFSEPLLGLMNYLATGACPPGAVEALLCVGSTSGRDTLAGMFYALHQSGSGWGREPGSGFGEARSLLE